MSQTEVQGVQMLRIEGGARVLVTLNQRATVAHYDQMRTLLADRFPDLEFTFIECVSGVLVQQEVKP